MFAESERVAEIDGARKADHKRTDEERGPPVGWAEGEERRTSKRRDNSRSLDLKQEEVWVQVDRSESHRLLARLVDEG
jgi:hypothetical protein